MYSASTMLTTYTLSIAVLIGVCQGQWGVDLGRDINNIVNQSLAPLHNLNLSSVINEEYQRELNNSRHRTRYSYGYGYGHGTPEYGYSYNYSYPGYSYSYSYPSRTSTVSRNFWKDLNERLESELTPVWNLQRILDLTGGYDGYTVVKFKPSNRVFLKRNDIMYECTGTLSMNNGQCDGDLKRFEVQNNNEDYCFLKNGIIFNNHLCFVPKDVGFIISVDNGKVVCKSHNINHPAFLISKDDYEKLCRNVATSADYVYFPNDNVDTKNLTCSGVHPKKCTYTEDPLIYA